MSRAWDRYSRPRKSLTPCWRCGAISVGCLSRRAATGHSRRACPVAWRSSRIAATRPKGHCRWTSLPIPRPRRSPRSSAIRPMCATRTSPPKPGPLTESRLRRAFQPLPVLHREVPAPPGARRRTDLHHAARPAQINFQRPAQPASVCGGNDHRLHRPGRFADVRRRNAELRDLAFRARQFTRNRASRRYATTPWTCPGRRPPGESRLHRKRRPPPIHPARLSAVLLRHRFRQGRCGQRRRCFYQRRTRQSRLCLLGDAETGRRDA